MAGIKGQPSPRPSDVKSPVPGQSELDDFMAQNSAAAASAKPMASGASDPALDSFMADQGTQDAAAQAHPILNKIADWAPTAGAVAGAVVGTPADVIAGPGGTVAGAGLGAAAGQSLKRMIEVNYLGKPADSAVSEAGGVVKEGLKSALEQYAGGKIMEGVGGLAAKTKVGQALIDGVSDMVSAPLNYLKQKVGDVAEAIQKPALDAIAPKLTQMTEQQSGDAVKQLVTQSVNQKYAPFLQAYKDLDAVGKQLPINEVSRYRFWDKTMDWARDELGGDQYRAVKQYAQDLLDADNGAKFDSVVRSIRDAGNRAYDAKAYDQAAVLKELRDRATDYMEGETTKLASKISSGNASPEEMGYLNQLAQQRGIPPEDVQKYAKSITSDYLKSKETIKNDYAGFREFLSNVSEQSKSKIGGKGPMAFMDALNDIPSEKLVERMFDPKNAAALQTMKEELPQVFDQVTQAKMTQIMKQASPTGDISQASLRTVRNQLAKMPTEARRTLLDDAGFAKLNAAVDNPKYKVLDSIEQQMYSSHVQWAKQLLDIGKAIVPGVAQDIGEKVQASPLVRQAVGSAAVNGGSALYNTFGPQQAPPQQ